MQDGEGPFGLPRQVWRLGWVSLFTDAATEAVYPLLPFFLTRQLRAGALALGVIEGLAEAANSVLKVLAGQISDRWNRRKPIIIAGYTLSSAAKPLIALATSVSQVLVIRIADRMGKGTRGAPRDAMLAAWATATSRGKVYGFHRAMDHLGAVGGPLLASVFLLAYPGRYRTLFALTAVPGAVAVWLLFRLPEVSAPSPGGPPLESPARNWRTLPRGFMCYLAVILAFTLGNSSDTFLLLRLTDVGRGPTYVPLSWATLHAVKAATSMLGGTLSDRWGRRPVIAAGWTVYALVYLGFATTSSMTGLVLWFLVYGLYFGLAEGPQKALVADLVPSNVRGTAFGLYEATLGLGALLASVVFGLLWKVFGAGVAFASGAGLAVVAIGLLFALVEAK